MVAKIYQNQVRQIAVQYVAKVKIKPNIWAKILNYFPLGNPGLQFIAFILRHRQSKMHFVLFSGRFTDEQANRADRDRWKKSEKGKYTQ